MIIQSPSILVRLGNVTASGIQVVPEPIRSILTPAGSTIMGPGIIACPEPAFIGPLAFFLTTGLFASGVEGSFFGGFSPIGMVIGIFDESAGGCCWAFARDAGKTE